MANNLLFPLFPSLYDYISSSPIAKITFSCPGSNAGLPRNGQPAHRKASPRAQPPQPEDLANWSSNVAGVEGLLPSPPANCLCTFLGADIN